MKLLTPLADGDALLDKLRAELKTVDEESGVCL